MLNPMDLAGRTVLVTGASSGIGRETSILLGQLGARVVLAARDRARLHATATALGGSALRVEIFDLAQGDAIPAWLKRVAEACGPLHGVVHCAGTQATLPVQQIRAGLVEEHLRVNVASTLALARGFRQKGVHSEAGASLVLVSSVMGFVGAPGRTLYAAGKGAILALTKSLALELARDKIRVNCVAPGFVRSEMLEQLGTLVGPEQLATIEAAHPLGFGEPRDVAQAIAFLLADTGRWMTGSTLVMDGGYTAR